MIPDYCPRGHQSIRTGNFFRGRHQVVNKLGVGDFTFYSLDREGPPLGSLCVSDDFQGFRADVIGVHLVKQLAQAGNRDSKGVSGIIK